MQEDSPGAERTVRPKDTGPARSVWLPLVGLLVGVWAMVPPYVEAFGVLDVEKRVEFADHVVPGIVVLAVAALSYLRLRSPQPSALLLFVAGATIALAGLWMVATHLPLVSQARLDQAPWGAVLWHSLPGVGVMLVGAIWTLRFWGADEADEAEVS